MLYRTELNGFILKKDNNVHVLHELIRGYNIMNVAQKNNFVVDPVLIVASQLSRSKRL